MEIPRAAESPAISGGRPPPGVAPATGQGSQPALG
jgi:hypothetical protein